MFIGFVFYIRFIRPAGTQQYYSSAALTRLTFSSLRLIYMHEFASSYIWGTNGGRCGNFQFQKVKKIKVTRLKNGLFAAYLVYVFFADQTKQAH